MIEHTHLDDTAHARLIRVQNPIQKLVAKRGNVVINAEQIQARLDLFAESNVARSVRNLTNGESM